MMAVGTFFSQTIWGCSKEKRGGTLMWVKPWCSAMKEKQHRSVCAGGVAEYLSKK